MNSSCNNRYVIPLTTPGWLVMISSWKTMVPTYVQTFVIVFIEQVYNQMCKQILLTLASHLNFTHIESHQSVFFQLGYWFLQIFFVGVLVYCFLQTILVGVLVPEDYLGWGIGSWRLSWLVYWFLQTILVGVLVLADYLG